MIHVPHVPTPGYLAGCIQCTNLIIHTKIYFPRNHHQEKMDSIDDIWNLELDQEYEEQMDDFDQAQEESGIHGSMNVPPPLPFIWNLGNEADTDNHNVELTLPFEVVWDNLYGQDVVM